MNEPKLINKFPKGKIMIPPSKSQSHRAVICASLAEGPSLIENIQMSQDITATASCLQSLGMSYKFKDGRMEIQGGLTKGISAALNCEESGSTLRFLIPIAGWLSGDISFTGSPRLMERPLNVYTEIFKDSPTKIERAEGIVRVTGTLTGGDYKIDGSVSSQFISGMLFVLPLLSSGGRLIATAPMESKGYVDMTIDVMEKFGVNVENNQYKEISVKGGQAYAGCRYRVEGDYSQAAFYLVAAAISGNHELECMGLNPYSLQGDMAILDILKGCGAQVVFGDGGSVKVRGEKLKALEVDVSQIPDLVPPLAVLLCFCQGRSRIYNAGRLRIKESDRLKSVSTELNKLGAKITEGPDYLEIEGVEYLNGGCADAWNDHRIAMAVAVAALRSRGEVWLKGASSVNKSYPRFWNDFEGE